MPRPKPPSGKDGATGLHEGCLISACAQPRRDLRRCGRTKLRRVRINHQVEGRQLNANVLRLALGLCRRRWAPRTQPRSLPTRAAAQRSRLRTRPETQPPHGAETARRRPRAAAKSTSSAGEAPCTYTGAWRTRRARPAPARVFGAYTRAALNGRRRRARLDSKRRFTGGAAFVASEA
jgi:hypothetical protein